MNYLHSFWLGNYQKTQVKEIIDRYVKVLTIISQFVYIYLTMQNTWPYFSIIYGELTIISLSVQLDEFDQLHKGFWKSSNDLFLTCFSDFHDS